MDFSKLRLGELVAAAAGILLLIVMVFFPWYGTGDTLGGLGSALGSAGIDATLSALQAFGLLDILLFLTVIAAIGAAVLAGTQSSVALPVAASVVVTALGILVTLLVLYRVVDPPGPSDLFETRIGAYIGLLLCAAIAVGGFMSMREEGTSFGQAASGLGGGTTGTPTRPAPPASGAATGDPAPPAPASGQPAAPPPAPGDPSAPSGGPPRV